MELLYYIDMTEEYYAANKMFAPGVDKNLHEQFLFKLGQVTGELGIGPVDLQIFDQPATHSHRVFLSFQNPEDAMAFKLKWI